MMKTYSIEGIEGIEAIEKLSSGSLLLDSFLISMRIFVQEYIVICELTIMPRPNSEFSEILLRIEGIRRFDFYYDEGNDFYLIDKYKAISSGEGGVYLSLDPYDEKRTESEEDCGVIVGKNVFISAS